jgi:hypothetical protein
MMSIAATENYAPANYGTPAGINGQLAKLWNRQPSRGHGYAGCLAAMERAEHEPFFLNDSLTSTGSYLELLTVVPAPFVLSTTGHDGRS